jgi:hypothetical protein
VANVIAEKAITYYYGVSSTAPRVLRLIQKPKGVLMPDAYPGDRELLSIDETNVDYFDDAETGYLLRWISRTIQPVGVTQPALFPGSLTRMPATETITDYSYKDEVTVAIATTTREQQGVVKPDPENTINATILTTASRTTQRWQKTNQGWQQSTSTVSYEGGGSASSTSYSTSGNNQPPAPERRQQENYGEEKQLRQIADLL